MSKTILNLIFLFVCTFAAGQNKEEADKLVSEGADYHDKGDFDGALAKYEQAFLLDKNNLLALSEKAYTLLTQEKFNEAIVCSEKAIAAHPDNEDLNTVKMTIINRWGNIIF